VVAITELTAGRGPFVAGTFFDLATVGYQQAEYAVRGDARAFEARDDELAVVETAPFTTRVVVYRPVDAAAFDGTVFVEWLNVSGGVDAAPDWMCAHRELIRAGAAWVGLSAQRVGIHGGASAMGMVAMALVELDPERYGGLDHPGDRFSYDLMTQVGAWARTGAGSILAGLPIERVIAIGESQSAFRLTTHINRIDAHFPEFDGYLVHARAGTASELHDDTDPRRIREGAAAPFRDDARVPVLCVQAETDLITLGYQVARQPDAEHLVVWEMAGTSHADVYTFAVGFGDDGLQPIEDLARLWRPSANVVGQQLEHPVNAGPQHYVMDAAVRWIDRWVRTGARPPASPKLQLADDGKRYKVDELGNALGGIRTPHVDVPTAVLSGEGNTGPPIAMLAGTTILFAREKLLQLYGTREAFTARVAESAAATADAGFFCDDDVEEVVAIASLNVDL
jgi:hypothetical protein